MTEQEAIEVRDKHLKEVARRSFYYIKVGGYMTSYVHDWQRQIDTALDGYRDLCLQFIKNNPGMHEVEYFNRVTKLDTYLEDIAPWQHRLAVRIASHFTVMYGQGFYGWLMQYKGIQIAEAIDLLEDIPGPSVARWRELLEEVALIDHEHHMWGSGKPSRVSSVEGRYLPRSEREPDVSFSGVYLDYKYRVVGMTPGGEEILEEYVEERYENTELTKAYARIDELTQEFFGLNSIIGEVGAYFMMLSNPMAD